MQSIILWSSRKKSAYEDFKHFVLTLTKPYYIFEGDVLDVIHIKREYDGIIELEPLSFFDTTNVLTKILGVRIDLIIV